MMSHWPSRPTSVPARGVAVEQKDRPPEHVRFSRAPVTNPNPSRPDRLDFFPPPHPRSNTHEIPPPSIPSTLPVPHLFPFLEGEGHNEHGGCFVSLRTILSPPRPPAVAGGGVPKPHQHPPRRLRFSPGARAKPLGVGDGLVGFAPTP